MKNCICKKDFILMTLFSAIVFSVSNSRGDIMELHNGPGQVTARYNYDACGKLISITDANGNALADGSFAHLISARYRGYYYDTETGLYYLQSRYLTDPGTSINQLALTPGNSCNLTTYVVNRPFTFRTGVVAPCAWGPGGGVQYFSWMSVQRLVQFRFLKSLG